MNDMYNVFPHSRSGKKSDGYGFMAAPSCYILFKLNQNFDVNWKADEGVAASLSLSLSR